MWVGTTAGNFTPGIIGHTNQSCTLLTLHSRVPVYKVCGASAVLSFLLRAPFDGFSGGDNYRDGGYIHGGSNEYCYYQSEHQSEGVDNIWRAGGCGLLKGGNGEF